MNHQPSELREFLANIQLWRGLPEKQLDALAKIAIAKTYRKGEVIFEEGDEGRGFFVVKSVVKSRAFNCLSRRLSNQELLSNSFCKGNRKNLLNKSQILLELRKFLINRV
ncbi:MAG TPA: cyclic nucleotide-binding domain-containing protein [Chroococcales cyanobacterium]